MALNWRLFLEFVGAGLFSGGLGRLRTPLRCHGTLLPHQSPELSSLLKYPTKKEEEVAMTLIL